MNPIFNRRYKGGGRPNIMPTSKRHNYQKSMSTASSGSMSSSSGSSSLMMGFSNGEDDFVEEPVTSSPSPHSEEPDPTMLFRTKSRQNQEANLLAHQLLASKQNMLAQLSLTPHENRQRAKFSGDQKRSGGGGGIRHSASIEGLGAASGGSGAMPRSPTVHDIGGSAKKTEKDEMKFTELEDVDDSEFTRPPPPPLSVSTTSFNSRIARPNLNQRICKQALDLKTWRELKQVVCGNTSFHEGWLGQTFSFDPSIPFGLVQKKGGPCGVLAVVQSLLLRNLLFGSPFSPAELNEGVTATMKDYLCGADEAGEGLRRHRVVCLVEAITEIIWTCGRSHCMQSDTSVIMFSDYRIQPEIINVTGRLELQHFLEDNLYRFDCVSLVYSAVLTRGISGVKEDMDFENCSLLGQHGYCSQELINLLALGKAISNTFDGEIELEGKVLQGITSQCDVGLLSLFEHYDSIKVGRNLKSPRFPVWIVCSESHFSVLFSTDETLCHENNNSDPRKFDLFYYDGLARQEKNIRLSIDLCGNPRSFPVGRSQGDSKSSSGRSSYGSTYGDSQYSSRQSDDDLTPPLEKCIRTKWRNADVDWNDTEPIL